MRRCKRILTAAFMALLCVALFSGCAAIGLDSQALMSPPRQEGDQGKIQDLLAETTGGEVTLRYPSKGEYRSAIILRDITGDRTNDALALYQSSEENGGTVVSFMTQSQGTWSVIRSFTNPAVQVDRVCFADLDDDGAREVVIGWGNSSLNSCSACVYDYTQDGILEIPMEQGYRELGVTTLMDDAQEELFVVTMASDQVKAMAQIVRLSEGALQIADAVALDPTVIQYSQLLSGLISPGQKGVVLDGLKADSTMFTQLIYWDSEERALTAPYSDKASQAMNITSRSPAAAYTSRDIDSNSIIEFPIATSLPGTDNTSTDSTTYLMNWNQFDAGTQTPVRVMSTVNNTRDGFWFLFPETWRDRVTCRSETSTRSTTFYEWLEDDGTGAPAVGTAILRIQVFTREEWQSNGKGYTKIAEQGGLVYGASIPEPNHELAPSISEVEESFHFLYTE